MGRWFRDGHRRLHSSVSFLSSPQPLKRWPPSLSQHTKGPDLSPRDGLNTTAPCNRPPGSQRTPHTQPNGKPQMTTPSLSTCWHERFLPKQCQRPGRRAHRTIPGLQTPGNPACLCRASGKAAHRSPSWGGVGILGGPQGEILPWLRWLNLHVDVQEKDRGRKQMRRRERRVTYLEKVR